MQSNNRLSCDGSVSVIPFPATEPSIICNRRPTCVQALPGAEGASFPTLTTDRLS